MELSSRKLFLSSYTLNIKKAIEGIIFITLVKYQDPYTVILFVTSKTLRSIFVIGKVFWATLLETVIRSFSYELAFFQL